MSTQELRGFPLRYKRRRTNLDLNAPPPVSENRDEEGPSAQVVFQELQINHRMHSIQHATIDVEAIDDDVVESSPRAFAEAKNNLRRRRGSSLVVDLDSVRIRSSHNNRGRHRRISPPQTVINCDHYINLETNVQAPAKGAVAKVPPPPPPPPPPPKEPTFNCPICMGPLVEETSTRCGHIFCKKCIKAAIAAQNKCPTCRKRITTRELIRVFLPAAS